MTVYSVIALDADKRPTGLWVLGNSPDDAANRATARLPEGGRIVLIKPITMASLTQFERTRLHELLDRGDSQEFMGSTVIELIKIQHVLINRQIEVVNELREVLDMKIELLNKEIDP